MAAFEVGYLLAEPGNEELKPATELSESGSPEPTPPPPTPPPPTDPPATFLGRLLMPRGSTKARMLRPIVAMVLLRFAFAGLTIIAKAALVRGMSPFTFAFYRNLIATITFAPFALILERGRISEMTLPVLYKTIFLGFVGVFEQNMYYAGMKRTSATSATGLYNLLPVITFVLCWIFRQDRVNFRKLDSQVKIVGTVVTLVGATIMTFIDGPAVAWLSKHKASTQVKNYHHSVTGDLMILVACLFWAGFHIVQGYMLKTYENAELLLTTLICTMATIQSAIITLVMERGNSAIWAIQLDIRLAAYIYGGIICSGVAYYVGGTVMKVKGPIFVTAFYPLTMFVVSVMSSFILDEQLYWGKFAGAFIIVIGLYLVLWGYYKQKGD